MSNPRSKLAEKYQLRMMNYYQELKRAQVAGEELPSLDPFFLQAANSDNDPINQEFSNLLSEVDTAIWQ